MTTTRACTVSEPIVRRLLAGLAFRYCVVPTLIFTTIYFAHTHRAACEFRLVILDAVSLSCTDFALFRKMQDLCPIFSIHVYRMMAFL